MLTKLMITNSCTNKTNPTKCESGTYAPGGVGECYACPKGAFCPITGLSNYFLCSVGSYGDELGLVVCKSCDAGYRCPSVGMQSAELCPNGWYNNATGSGMCFSCPEGHR